MLSSTQVHSLGYLACHLASQAAMSRRTSARSRRSPGSGFAGPRTGSEPAQLLQAVVVDLAWDIVEGVPEEVDVTALPDRLRQDLADRLLQPRMVVGDHELHPEQAAALEQEVLPARPA